MFGSSKRRVFQPTAYGSSRRKRRIPRWLVLMLSGIVLGAGGLLFLQKSYGPTRLTIEQSEQLHYDLNSSNMDKQRLQSQLNQHARDLKQSTTTVQEQAAQLKQVQAQVAKLTGELKLFADAMPSDPRGTSPGIRAASFSNTDGQLQYQILVMQDSDKTTTFTGEMELIVAGRYANRKSGNIDLAPVSIELQRYSHVGGTAALPEGFVPRQVTIKITAQGAKKLSATRTIRVGG